MPVSLLPSNMSFGDGYSYNKKSIMQFCRIGSIIEPRENGQLLFDRPCKSPLRSLLPKGDHLQPDNSHHMRVQSAFFSPSPSSPALRKLECRPISPVPLPHQERSALFNPETPKSQRTSDLNPNAPHQPKVSTKMRKNSENFLLPHRSEREGQCDEREQVFASFINTKAPEKYRKGSCQLLEAPVFFKKERKKSTNEEAVAAPKRTAKGKGWDETNNFQLSTNNSEENSGPDLTHSLIEQPRLQTHRKHSDNCNIRKVPAFLSPRAPRKSFDYVLRSGASIEDFLIVKELGKGAFGRVVLAVEKRSGLACAIKILAKREVAAGGMAEQVARELKLQMFVSHPNVVKVYGYFDDLLHFYIIMECALDGHLSELLARKPAALPEEEAAVLFHQTCSAVSVLHRYSIIHRDLKPENLLMHEGIIKISDFGWSVQRGAGLRTTFCGTPLYLSPEVLLGDEYDESVDIWALGVILYEMLSRENPFRITCQEQLGRILDAPVTFSEGLSSAARELIEGCLSKRAHHRPNIRELMLHEFVLRGVAAEELKR